MKNFSFRLDETIIFRSIKLFLYFLIPRPATLKYAGLVYDIKRRITKSLNVGAQPTMRGFLPSHPFHSNSG